MFHFHLTSILSQVRSKGYTGHLRLISNRIEELGDSEDWLAQLVKGGEWRQFADGYLQTSNDVNDRRKLGQSTVRELSAEPIFMMMIMIQVLCHSPFNIVRH